ncbi:MAG: hypothetical protein ACODAD_11955 [Planctomycetota bacterium]
MATPSLLIGAVPQLANALPKPAPWLNAFKQLVGLFLIGTVLFLFLSVPGGYRVPTAALLGAVGIACWRLGRRSPGVDT